MADKKKWSELFKKLGLTELATVYENSPEGIPDEIDLEQIATDHKGNMFSVLKSSDEFKDLIKGNSVASVKKYNKNLNEKHSLGLSNTEIEKMEPDEVIALVTKKYEDAIEASKNGHTKEWQDKHKAIESEFTAFKKKYEVDTGELKKAVETEATRAKQTEILAAKNKKFEETFVKRKYANVENAKDILEKYVEKNAIQWNEEGKIFKGESDVVLAADGITILPDLDKLFDHVGKLRELEQQSNGGADKDKPPNPTFSPTGNPAADLITQATVAHALEMNKHL